MNLVDPAGQIQRKRHGVEEQLNLQRPVNPIDMGNSHRPWIMNRFMKAVPTATVLSGSPASDQKERHDNRGPEGGKSRLKRETTKSSGRLTRCSVMKMTKPLIMKNRLTP